MASAWPFPPEPHLLFRSGGSRQLPSVCPNYTSGPGAGIPGRGQGQLHPQWRRTCARTGPPQAPLWPMGLLEFVSIQNQRPEAPEGPTFPFPWVWWLLCSKAGGRSGEGWEEDAQSALRVLPHGDPPPPFKRLCGVNWLKCGN